MRVLGGPALQRLTAIPLEVEDTAGGPYASGTFGGEMHEQFFAKLGFRIALENGTADIERHAEGTPPGCSPEQYGKRLILC